MAKKKDQTVAPVVEPVEPVSRRDAAALARAGERLGVPVSELVSVEDSPAGTIYTGTDGSRIVDVPADRPDADGKTGLMFLVAPTDPYNGTFPVYAHELDDDDPAELTTELLEFDAVSNAEGVWALVDAGLVAAAVDGLIDEADIPALTAYLEAGGTPAPPLEGEGTP